MMNNQIIRWCVDVALGITFLASLITGLLKLTVLVRAAGPGHIILPLALISDIHDTAGVLLGILVFIHLFLNRQWIVSTTRRIISGTADT